MHLLPDTVYMFMPTRIEFVPTGLLEDFKAVNPGGGISGLLLSASLASVSSSLD